MALIVNDSYELSSQAPTLAEKLKRAETWARQLQGIIPEHGLQPAFDRAFREHETDFSINAYTLKAAWSKIAAEREQAEQLRREHAAKNDPVANCTSGYNHADSAGNIEWCPGPGHGDYLVPCGICQKDAFVAAANDIRSACGLIGNQVTNVIEAEFLS